MAHDTFIDPHMKAWNSIGSFAEALIVTGMTNKEALEAVLLRFPEAKTTEECIRWYRARLRKKNPRVPTNREVQRALSNMVTLK